MFQVCFIFVVIKRIAFIVRIIAIHLQTQVAFILAEQILYVLTQSKRLTPKILCLEKTLALKLSGQLLRISLIYLVVVLSLDVYLLRSQDKIMTQPLSNHQALLVGVLIQIPQRLDQQSTLGKAKH